MVCRLGEERKAINKAIDNLIKVIRESGDLKKALDLMFGNKFYILQAG